MDNIITVDVGRDFYPKLTNRDKNQGDGKHTAIEFRDKYLAKLDSKNSWTNSNKFITLDFINVDKIGPSFANEAFAYFTKYADQKTILSKIELINISEVKFLIIVEELDSGYNRSWRKII